jgi:hypothetical protein
VKNHFLYAFIIEVMSNDSNTPHIVNLAVATKQPSQQPREKKSADPNALSPLSGSEPQFEPAKWNSKGNIRDTHNCYAYLLNTIASKRKGKPQPGYFSGFNALKESDYKCGEFYKRLKKDIPTMYVSTFGNKCAKGYYKGFVALDPKTEDQDYHFYRQDNHGYWSHKPGKQDAIDYDANGKKIADPVKANRKYKYFNYSKPCFYFCINNKLARSRS